MRCPGWIAAALIACGMLSASRIASAERRLTVVAAGTCPARAAVVSALAQAMPDAKFVEAVPDAEPVIVISDSGPSYRAVVGGVERTLVDPAGACEERARKIAVVAALALEPPQIAAAPAVLETREVAPARSTEPPRSAARRLRVETGMVSERGRIQSELRRPVGAMARVTVDVDPVGLVFGTQLVTVTLVDAAVWVQRIPLDVAAQLRGRVGWLAGSIELGPTLVVRSDRRRGTYDHEFRLEADYRMAGRLELWPLPHVGVVAAVAATYAPSPTPANDTLLGRDLQMPHWWLGFSAGVIMELP